MLLCLIKIRIPLNLLSNKDFIITPIFIIILLIIATSFNKSINKDKISQQYFIKGVYIKIFAVLAFTFIHEYIYGGDTVLYFKQSKIIFDSLFDKPIITFNLLWDSRPLYDYDSLSYAMMIGWYGAPTEYMIVKFAALGGLFSGHTYSAIALFFATFSFSGLWAIYKTLTKIYPDLKKEFAIATVFMPSVFFWSAGVLKDGLCIGALGWLFWAFYSVFIEKKSILKSIIIGFLAFILVSKIKFYIALAFMPSALLWIFLANRSKIRNKFIRTIATPFLLVLGLGTALLGGSKLMENSEYSADHIATRTKINSDYIYGISQIQQGSAYSIGKMDGTVGGMVKVLPQAVNVALFRPYLFEVKNPVMLLSSFESTFFLLFTIYVLFKVGFFKVLGLLVSNPLITFCFIFSIIMAAAVGMNSFNFGSLVRYKIPLMPFYLAAIYLLKYEGIDKKKVNGKIKILN